MNNGIPSESTDVRSNLNEQLDFAARALGHSNDRKKVFRAIYAGKKRHKTVSEIMAATGLNRIRVLQEAGALCNNRLVKKTKVDAQTAYQKDTFIAQYKERILSYAGNPKALSRLPTKRRPRTSGPTVQYINFPAPKRKINARWVTIDEIYSFKSVKRIEVSSTANKPMLENSFQKGLQKILGEEGVFNDWGGEGDDLFSTHLIIDSIRLRVAFGLKGRGTTGKLVPSKMGKNGDQIQRLFRSPADVFIVQYWGQIDSSVIEQMKAFAEITSVLQERRIYYGIIDGKDTQRLLSSYRAEFAS